MYILTIIGARPQFIKAAALSRYIKNNPRLYGDGHTAEKIIEVL